MMKISTALAAVLLSVSLACPGSAIAQQPASRPAVPEATPADRAPLISPAELVARLKSPDSSLVILDVRTPMEFAAGHVPGARNISHDQLASRLDELAALKDMEVVLYCRSGRRTQIAEQTLRGAGFTRLRHLEGDYLAWEAAKHPVERSAP